MADKISTVIARLQELLEREGDQEVVVDCDTCRHLDRVSVPRYVSVTVKDREAETAAVIETLITGRKV